MLKIWFGDNFPKNIGEVNSIPYIWFDNQFSDEWITSEFGKRVIKEIDNGDVISPYCIKTPIFGAISYQILSGGVKTLMVMNFTDLIVDATVCGENCAKYILEIASKKDLTIQLNYVMPFDDYDKNFTFLCLNSNKICTGSLEYINAFIEGTSYDR